MQATMATFLAGLRSKVCRTRAPSRAQAPRHRGLVQHWPHAAASRRDRADRVRRCGSGSHVVHSLPGEEDRHGGASPAQGPPVLATSPRMPVRSSNSHGCGPQNLVQRLLLGDGRLVRQLQPSVGPILKLWHDERMVTFARIALRLIEDALSGVVLLLRSTVAVRAENLFLRRQLALCIERGVRPRRVDAAGRIAWRYWRGCSIGEAPWCSCSRRP